MTSELNLHPYPELERILGVPVSHSAGADVNRLVEHVERGFAFLGKGVYLRDGVRAPAGFPRTPRTGVSGPYLRLPLRVPANLHQAAFQRWSLTMHTLLYWSGTSFYELAGEAAMQTHRTGQLIGARSWGRPDTRSRPTLALMRLTLARTHYTLEDLVNAFQLGGLRPNPPWVREVEWWLTNGGWSTPHPPR